MIICIDLETTWLDKYSDKIIEIAMVKFDERNFKIIDTYTALVNPEIEIPELISNITNITNQDVEGAPLLIDLKKEIIEFIGDTPLLWHNVSFDSDFFINNWIDLSDNILIDTFFLANIISFDKSSLNLEMLCNDYNIPFVWAHRALNDVLATIELFKTLIKEFSKLAKEKKHLLYFIFNKAEDKNIEYLRFYMFDNIDSNLSFKDFEKKILKHVWTLENDETLIVDKKIDNKKMSNYFEALWNVEKRENQLKMTEMVMKSFTKKQKVVIEAPTWLWKSFAYLIPSIIHSLRTWKKVFVSTKTKTLQDQLYNKDLSFLKENMGVDFRFTKLKWKKNYLSIKLLFDEFWIDDIAYTKVWFLSKIVLWLYSTVHWELDELNFYGQEFSFIRNVNADNFSVIWEKNDYVKYEYLFKARVRLESSNIIVINHSLLFSDLNTETPVLWKVTNLVIDEWHNIEDTVTESLRKSYNLVWILDLFSSVEKILDKIKAKKIEFLKNKESLISKLEVLDDYWYSYINGQVDMNQKYKVVLQKSDFFEELDFTQLVSKIELNIVDIVDFLAIQEWHDFSKEIALMQWRLDIVKIMLDKTSDKENIKTISYNDNTGVSFDFTLLNPWEYLNKNLRNKLSTCILTSATLEIWGSFDYIKKLLFLDDFDFKLFESDFDYKKQSTLFIPTDIGNIKNNSDEIVDFLWKFFILVKWKVLTLLTSYFIIKKIYTALNGELKENWINLYAQWVAGSKIKLLSFYLKNPSKSILLWTDSFWEWVDIPWEDLKYLIIHKFPFSVPTDPIFQARSVFFDDPFLEYSVPKAIIKLKQWFWRLIRSKKDNWVVVLLDNRILSTWWWKHFFDAFPSDINIKKGSKDNFLDILEKKS